MDAYPVIRRHMFRVFVIRDAEMASCHEGQAQGPAPFRIIHSLSLQNAGPQAAFLIA